MYKCQFNPLLVPKQSSRLMHDSSRGRCVRLFCLKNPFTPIGKPLSEAKSTACEEKSQPIRPDSEHKQSSFELLEDFSVDLRYLTPTALCEAVDAR
jgi:hypothetical protein